MSESTPAHAASPPPRDQRGATTAEYAGIAVVIVAIIGVVLGLTTPVLAGASDVTGKVYCRLATLLGGISGCAPEHVPGHIPTKCTVKKGGSTYGGSITVIATVEGESGYELSQVRTLNPDGTVSTRYVVKTKGKVGANYTLKGGGGVEVDTGSESKDAKAGLSINIGADGAWGSQYTFDNLDDANAFIGAYGDNFGEFGSEPEGAPQADLTYFDLSGQVKGSGEAGPLSGNASGAVTLGAEQHSNGNTKVKVALTAKAAADLGIPIPDTVLAMNANGDASLAVTADITFDESGQVVSIGGTIVGTVNGKVDAGVNEQLVKGTEIGEDTTIKGLNLPPLAEGLEGGYQFELGFTTNFQRPDGTTDHSALSALSEGLANFLTSGEGLTPEQQQAIATQLNEHSQITFNHYTVDKEETKYGGKVSVLWVNIGGEVHKVTVDNDLIGSYFYDPVLGTWQENTVCNG